MQIPRPSRSVLRSTILAACIFFGIAACATPDTRATRATRSTRAKPAPPAARTTFAPGKSVAAGAYHTCAIQIDNGQVICWGNDENGQSSGAPKNTSFDAVAAGWDHTCAIRKDNQKIVC